jgi:hypothetical protein
MRQHWPLAESLAWSLASGFRQNFVERSIRATSSMKRVKSQPTGRAISAMS